MLLLVSTKMPIDTGASSLEKFLISCAVLPLKQLEIVLVKANHWAMKLIRNGYGNQNQIDARPDDPSGTEITGSGLRAIGGRSHVHRLFPRYHVDIVDARLREGSCVGKRQDAKQG